MNICITTKALSHIITLLVYNTIIFPSFLILRQIDSWHGIIVGLKISRPQTPNRKKVFIKYCHINELVILYQTCSLCVKRFAKTWNNTFMKERIFHDILRVIVKIVAFTNVAMQKFHPVIFPPYLCTNESKVCIIILVY